MYSYALHFPIKKPMKVIGVAPRNKPKDVKLKPEECCLLFTWIASEGSEDLSLSILLSTSADNGVIFPSNVPTSVHKALFGTSQTLNSSIQEILCYIVACNSGEVLLIDTFEGGSVRKICRAHGSVVWADFVTVSDCECFYLLERTGQLCIGTFSHHKVRPVEDLFLWQTLSLSMSPICGVKIESSLISDKHLVLSDGHASYLCLVSKNSKTQEWVCKEKCLPFWGVVRLEKKDIVVVMTTCDGREYRKTLLELTRLNEEENPEEIHRIRNLGNLNLPNVMEAIKHCSEIIKDKSIRLSKINLYLEQLSIASLWLFNTPEKLFKINFKIEASLERDGCYLLLLELQFNSQFFKLKGPWWQLSIRLKDCSTVNYTFNDIQELCTSNKAEYHIYIPIEIVEKLAQVRDGYSLLFELDLVFGHFVYNSPIFLIKAHRETIDLIHFLKLHRSDSVYNYPFPNFKKSVIKLFSCNSFANDSNTISQTLISTHFKHSILIFEKHMPILRILFPDYISSVGPVTTMLWLHNLSITLTCERTTSNAFRIVLESSSKSLVVAIKIAIERRALQNYRLKVSEDSNNISLPSAVLCNTNVCKLLLDLETSQTPSQLVVHRLYESVNNLISSIPL